MCLIIRFFILIIPAAFRSEHHTPRAVTLHPPAAPCRPMLTFRRSCVTLEQVTEQYPVGESMLSTSQRSLAFLVLLVICPGVLADDELTLHLGVRTGGEVESGNIRIDSLEFRPSVGLTYSHKLRPQGWLWTTWSLQATEFNAPGLLPDRDTIDLDIHYVHIGTSYRSKIGDRTHGFVMFGLGLTWIDPPSEFDAAWGSSLLIGGGVRTPIRPGMVFRFDVRGYATFTNTTLRGRCGGSVCQISITGSGAFQLELLAGLTFEF